MSADATLSYEEECEAQRLAPAAWASGKVVQDLDGKGAVVAGLNAAASGDPVTLQKEGIFEMPKTASIVMLAGGRAYWDRTNSKVTFKRVTGGFYLGTVHADAAAADATVLVNLNQVQFNRIDWNASTWTSVAVGDATAVKNAVGSRATFTIAATSEAEKIDALSDQVISIADGPILEGRFAYSATAGSAVDISIGLANGTHASDADAITEHVFFHVDGGALLINAQSKDGTTTVAATDTTIAITVDATTFVEVWIDARDPTNVKLYINGVRALSSTAFKLNAGTGPLKALFHVEKTTGTNTGACTVEFLNVRSTDLA